MNMDVRKNVRLIKTDTLQKINEASSKFISISNRLKVILTIYHTKDCIFFKLWQLNFLTKI